MKDEGWRLKDDKGENETEDEGSLLNTYNQQSPKFIEAEVFRPWTLNHVKPKKNQRLKVKVLAHWYTE